MKASTKNLIQPILQIIMIVVMMFGVAGSAVVAPEPTSRYIVQAGSVAIAKQVVMERGGEVVADLEIINAVSADLSAAEYAEISLADGIVAITADYQVSVSSADMVGAADEGKTSTDYPEVSGADVVWEIGYTGKDVTVAILDTGIAKLPSLTTAANGKARLLGWFDAISGSKKPIDPNGHGSHVAGIIANSDLGGDKSWNGVAPDANLVAVRVLNEEGNGTYESVIKGLQWVVDNKDKYNIRVVNMSLVSTVESPYWADPLNQAVTAAWAKGLVVVTAAGNIGPDAMTITVPGNNPYVITVGAFTDAYTVDDWSDDYIADFSSAGPTLDGFVKPDLVAPGGHISSITPQTAMLNDLYPDNRQPANYFKMAGTSQATGVVSGVAALILSKNPQLSNNEVKYRLTNTALIWLDAEGVDASYSMWQQGAGRLNAVDAVFTEEAGSANEGMNILADLAGEEHYEGYSYYDEATDTIRLYEPFDFITGKYGIWDGKYGIWAGKYGIWAGESMAWAGKYGIWAGKYGIWAGKYGIWDGRKGIWDGRKGIWDGRKGIWAGSEFISNFAAGQYPQNPIGSATISNFVLEK